VVCGAVLRGIEGAITTERRCRRHYGYECSELYDPLKYPNYDKTKRWEFKDAYSERHLLSGFMTWFVSKVCNSVTVFFHLAKYSTDRMMSYKLTGTSPEALIGSSHLQTSSPAQFDSTLVASTRVRTQ
jgi:hypothetical protein